MSLLGLLMWLASLSSALSRGYMRYELENTHLTLTHLDKRTHKHTLKNSNSNTLKHTHTHTHTLNLSALTMHSCGTGHVSTSVEPCKVCEFTCFVCVSVCVCLCVCVCVIYYWGGVCV